MILKTDMTKTAVITTLESVARGAGPSCDFIHGTNLAIGLLALLAGLPSHLMAEGDDLCSDAP